MSQSYERLDDELSADDLIDRLLEVARSRLGMELSWLSSFVGDQQVFDRLCGQSSRFGLHAGISAPFRDSYCARVIAGRLPNLIPDVAQNPEASALGITKEASIGSYIGVPIRGDDDIPAGMLCCISGGEANHLSERDVRTLEMVAELMSEILKNEPPAWRRDRSIVDRVRAAIDGKQMSFVFQPIVDIRSGAVLGVEALCRFELSPDRPAVWFNDAMSVGLGVELELEAIALALECLRELDPSLSLTVNASPATICDPRVLGLILEFDPRRVVVEITEHAPVDDYQVVRDAIGVLSEAGVRIAVDDAGAGFASLAHILEIQPAIVKIDRSVVKGIHLDPARRALAQAIIDIGEKLGAVVVAEGVELQEELDSLASLGVTFVQGYLLARPGPLPTSLQIQTPMPVAVANAPVAPPSLEDLMTRRFELAMIHSPVGTALVSTIGTFLHANPALAAMLQCSERELCDHSLRSVLHRGDLVSMMSMFDECLAGTRSSCRAERRFQRSDGTVIWGDVSIVLVRSGDRPMYFILQVQDVTDRRRRETDLTLLADTDYLTSAANRSAGHRHLEALAVSGVGFGVLYCDLRSFKAINDKFGHRAGDHVLTVVAGRLRAVVRSGDLVSRWGGDEFLVAVSGGTPGHLRRVKRRMLEVVGLPIQLPGRAGSIEPELTVGCSRCESGDQKSVEEVLHLADTDMYRQRSVLLSAS